MFTKFIDTCLSAPEPWGFVTYVSTFIILASLGAFGIAQFIFWLVEHGAGEVALVLAGISLVAFLGYAFYRTFGGQSYD